MFSNIGDDAFVIAEVGQNHQGDFQIAKEYVRIFSFEGADAIKFQKRDNKYLFSEDAYQANYESENAFAKTYGEHREKLELSSQELSLLREDCARNGVKFMVTPFDEPSLADLIEIGVDILKIASFDLGNLPFIDKIAKTQIPVVLSVGGGKASQIQESVNAILKYHSQLSILHCVSEYPCEYNKLGLSNIEKLKTYFPEITIGLSDHFNGTLSGPIAYMKGARVFEKHVTLNRAWKGTDHSFALEPEGFRKFVRDIKRVRFMMNPKAEEELGKEKVFAKLGKSLVASTDLRKGDVLTLDNLSGKIFKQVYIPVRDSHLVIGKEILKDIQQGQPISIGDLQ